MDAELEERLRALSAKSSIPDLGGIRTRDDMRAPKPAERLLATVLQPDLRSWVAQAACRGMDPELFFPSVGISGEQIMAVKEICSGCAVRTDCLEYAINNSQRMGIWGGTTDRQRRKIISQRKGEQ